MNVRRVVIVTNPKQPQVARVADGLVGWFESKKNIKASLAPGRASKADLTVVVGGDGTLRVAARRLGDRQSAIRAVNHGGVGLVTVVTVEDMYPAMERVLAGLCIT